MGKKKRLKLESAAAEKFSMSVGDPAFASWWFGADPDVTEIVTPYTVMGLSAVLRSVQVISGTIAGLPLKTYERDGDERERIESVFDDPFPGIDGMTSFAWTETILIHLLLWRKAFLWHEKIDAQGNVTAYRPLIPDAVSKVERINGHLRFTYRDGDGVDQVVGTEQITYIPGPSMDGLTGHPFLSAARSIFAGAISGDKSAARTLRMGIRLAGLMVPEENEDVQPEEAAAILEELRNSVVGREHAGDVAVINRRMKLQPWTPTNIESQWMEARQMALGEVERLFGMPPHLLADTEKQTSWGTGVAEQNAGLARYTLMGWSSRLEQGLSRRLPTDQFCEYDYYGLLQGTPAEAQKLVTDALDAGLITLDYACKVLNLPAPTPDQTAAQAAKIAPPAPPRPIALPQEVA